jgi:hypothetical protein
MVKKIVFLVFILASFLCGNIYEKNCVACHKTLPVSIDKYFYRYLLKYSSESSVNEAMAKYLRNPSKDTTIMPEAFISRFGIKKPTLLSDDELQKALEEYWEVYKVFGKLK